MRFPQKLYVWISSLLWFSSQSIQLKRIAILGCGPAGLCLSSVLVKFLPPSWDGTISMYDSRSDILQTNLGGGIQVSGGNNVLIKLGLFEKFKEIAQPINSILSRNKDSRVLFQLNIPELINKDKYANRNLLYNDNTKTTVSENELSSTAATSLSSPPLKPLLYSIMRDALQQILYDSIKNDPRVRIIPSTTCVNVVEVENTNDYSSPSAPVSLKFITEQLLTNDAELAFNSTSASTITASSSSYSSSEQFDVVFCADGIKSIGIDHVINSWKNKEAALNNNNSGMKNALTLLYDKLSQGWKSGMRISYGITDLDNSFYLRPTSSAKESFHQYFGDGCYALIASYGGLKPKVDADGNSSDMGGIQHMLAVVYTGDGSDGIGNASGDRSNVKWNSNVAVRDQVLSRLKASGLDTIPHIMTVFNGCMEDRWIDLGVRDRVLPLRHWGSATGRVVLCGDSAHAMPPFFGQGANQALQDSYILGKGLADVIRLQQSYAHDVSLVQGSQVQQQQLSDSSSQWKEVIENYENKRKFFTALLSAKSSVLGRIETLGGEVGMNFRDNFFRIVYAIGVVEKSFLDAARPRL